MHGVSYVQCTVKAYGIDCTLEGASCTLHCLPNAQHAVANVTVFVEVTWSRARRPTTAEWQRTEDAEVVQ